jgi:excisionase family DNA binding protein
MNMDYRDPEWLAERLGLDKNTLYKFLQDGKIPAIQLGRKWLISEARVQQWLSEETERQTIARRASVSSMDRTVRQMTFLSRASRDILRSAYAHARRLNHRHVGQEHLLLAMREAPSLGKLLGSVDRSMVEIPSSSLESPPRRMGRKPLTRRAMRLASVEARRLGAKAVEPAHLLLGMLQTQEGAAYQSLDCAGVSVAKVLKTLKSEPSGKTKEQK